MRVLCVLFALVIFSISPAFAGERIVYSGAPTIAVLPIRDDPNFAGKAVPDFRRYIEPKFLRAIVLESVTLQ